MRATYAIVGLVITAGVIAFFSMQGAGNEDAGASTSKQEQGKAAVAAGRSGDAPRGAAKPAGKGPIGLKRESGAGTGTKLDLAAEKLAQDLLRKRAEAERADKAAELKTLDARIRKEVWDTAAARRHATARGRALHTQAMEGTRGVHRITKLDQARRLMSRGVFLSEMFSKSGRDTAERTRLIGMIQEANRQVMTWRQEIPGVTKPYKVKAGMTPARIVFRKDIVRPTPLSVGPNAVLYWNQGGNLDPAKLRAHKTLMLPLEDLTVHVHKRLYRLAVFIGDWYVKEWHVGIGMPGKDTPVGNFQVHSKEENPVWYAPDGRTIHPGTKENELGSRWIAIHDPVRGTLALEDGIGIHGTPKPETVGTRCSNGCVRLRNGDVEEVFWWIRTGNGGGQASRIHIYP